MIAARGEGWDSSLPKILKMDPDNCPYHDEYTGHSCQGQRRKEEKETGAENTGRGFGGGTKEREGEGRVEHLGLLLQCACCSWHKDSLRVTDSVCLRVYDHLDRFFFLF